MLLGLTGQKGQPGLPGMPGLPGRDGQKGEPAIQYGRNKQADSPIVSIFTFHQFKVNKFLNLNFSASTKY